MSSSQLKHYEELDEDELLASLSSAELQELESELAAMEADGGVPVGLRQRDQTARIPTAPFDRDALLRYWETQNKKLLQDPAPEADLGQDQKRALVNGESCKAADIDKRKTQQKKKAGKSKDARKQSEEKSGKCKKEKTGETGDQVSSERPSGNPVVVAEALEQILSNEPSVTELNLNNVDDVSRETLLRFAQALHANTHVLVFSLANTRADDRVAFAIADMLRENRSVRTLNVESNFLSGRGVLSLLAALRHNRTLMELRFHNQRHICGGKVEMEMVQLLRENCTLIKLGYQFLLPGPRMAATGILTRNQDQQRQRRLQQKKEQSPPDVSNTKPQKKEQNPPDVSNTKPQKKEQSPPDVSNTKPQKKEQSPPDVSNTKPQKKEQSPSDVSNTKPQKKPLQSHHNIENQRRNPPPLDPPTRKIAETVRQRDDSDGSKLPPCQRRLKSKKLKDGTNEKEGTEILKDLKNALKPSLQKRRDESPRLPPLKRSSRDDLMAAIRGSSIGSLKRADHSDLNLDV